MKRLKSFMDVGWSVTGFTFKRTRQQGQFEPFWDNVDLGTLSNGRYFRRLATLASALGKAFSARETLRKADVIYARNLDCALIAIAAGLFAGSRALLCYEVNDIRGVFVRNGLKSKAARWLERIVLNRADWLVTSSPRFKSEYFEKIQGYRGRTFVLENKIYDSADGSIAKAREELSQTEQSGQGPIVIGWFGVLDCHETWNAIREAASQYGDRVHFYMRGFPEYIEDEFYSACEAMPNLEYGGKFNNRVDLPDMYRRVHAVCGFDFKEPGRNSSWLMPNSFYETGAFCRPLLASEGTATAESVLAVGGGWALKLPLTPAFSAFVEGFSWEDWRAKVTALSAVPLSRYAGQDQFLQLVSDLAGEAQDRAADTKGA